MNTNLGNNSRMVFKHSLDYIEVKQWRDLMGRWPVRLSSGRIIIKCARSTAHDAILRSETYCDM